MPDENNNSSDNQESNSNDSEREYPDRDTSTYQERSENQEGDVKK